MMWLEYISIFWPIVATVTPFFMVGFMLWLKSQFTTKAELETERQIRAAEIAAEAAARAEVGSIVTGLETRLTVLEAECRQIPTRGDLNNSISNIGERLGGLEASIKGMIDSARTQGEYVRVLVENSMKNAA